MPMMRTDEKREYQQMIIKPLLESIERAGGVEVVARQAGMSQSRLKVILYKNNTMNVNTLMQLCSVLKITLVFMDMDICKKAFHKTLDDALMKCIAEIPKDKQ